MSVHFHQEWLSLYTLRFCFSAIQEHLLVLTLGLAPIVNSNVRYQIMWRIVQACARPSFYLSFHLSQALACWLTAHICCLPCQDHVSFCLSTLLAGRQLTVVSPLFSTALILVTLLLGHREAHQPQAAIHGCHAQPAVTVFSHFQAGEQGDMGIVRG